MVGTGMLRMQLFSVARWGTLPQVSTYRNPILAQITVIPTFVQMPLPSLMPTSENTWSYMQVTLGAMEMKHAYRTVSSKLTAVAVAQDQILLESVVWER